MNREELLAHLRRHEADFDPGRQLVRIPLTATYHTALKPDRHPVVYGLLGSVDYAFHLLKLGDGPSVERAAAILRRVAARQDRDPVSATYGIWPYYDEEPLNEMDRPDWNMADFHGKLLCLILKRHGGQLPAELAALLREALGHACRAIVRRDVGPGYTNIAIMGAFVTLAGGELLADEELCDYGLARLKRLYEYTMEIGAFSEYNSPCYTTIAIRELHAVLADSESAEAHRYAQALTDLAWRATALHYHAPTAAWGGPHSRSYSTLLLPVERRFLADALQDAPSEYGETIRCPQQYRPLFAESGELLLTERTLMASETGYQAHATLYRNEALSLGSFSRGVMWNQRRNLLAYVRIPEGTVYVQLQFLMNGRDFCSAMYTGVQDRARALFGFNWLLDNGAWHSDLDKIDGRFRASDLRIRLALGGDTEALPVPRADESLVWRLPLGEATVLTVGPVWERCDEGPLRAENGRDEEGRICLDYVVYAGEERDFDFHAIREAAWLFALSLDSSGALPGVTVRETERTVAAALGSDSGGEIEIARSPGATQVLYAANRVRLPASLGGAED
ncbi:hypothetical protein [Cohnella fermenti]|uniref:Heparinase n=1 Tax=Cohnella fermenti TaxID=2565925 RepID=A0A4S4BK75_9BACL|nr:hypothetical protein [Cohnella fermenti]THF74151.1 hypothetical protein E6C55_26370 [Cohnella fermenti]